MNPSIPSSSRTGTKNAQLVKVEILFILLLLIFGVPMAVLIPPGAGYDEEDHLVRVWELSGFSFLPGQLSPRELQYPILFRDFAYRQQGSSGIIDSEFWQRYARASLYEDGFVRREIDTKSVYSPALLLPQAITMRVLGRTEALPALIAFYASRLASLLSYLVLVWLAIRWMPFGKWILLVLALSPIALFQAATLTPDAISNGLGFLFIAGNLRAAKLEKLDWKQVGTLILLVFLLFLTKLNLLPLILLPLLIVPPSKFTARGTYASLLITIVVFFLIEVVGWNVIAAARSAPLLANEADPGAQLAYMAGHPFAFLQTLFKDFMTNGLMYFQGWVNGYGYYYWSPPQVVSMFFLLGLGFVLLFDSTREQVNRKFHIAFILVFIAGYLATIISLYATFTPVGADQVLGVQGRYFIPLALPLFLTLASFSWMRKLPAPSSTWAVAFLGTALSLNLLGIWLSFHVPCGSTFYQTGLCYRPLVRDFPDDVSASPSLVEAVSLTQELKVACDGLTELRVLASSSAPGDRGSTRFLLMDSMTDRTLFDTSIRNDEFSAENWYSVGFEPDWESAGKQYTLTIFGVDSTPEQGLKLLYTVQSEFDLGNLYQGKQLMQQDIVLQYGCAAGLRKIWLTGGP
jgi:uncharacterized membrane protein